MHGFGNKCFAIALLAIFLLTKPSFLSADELVKFDAAAPRSAPHRATGIQGYLTKPNGVGPFPAVVLLHNCLGLPVDRRSIGNMLAGWGYVALFVDDFAARGLKDTCAVDFGNEGASDAYGALLYLAQLPYVDPTKIAAVGYSQGADTALAVASSRFASASAIPDDLKFKAAAAFYPPCANEGTATLTIPTLILVGALDSVTPAADCERLAAGQPTDHSAVKLIVYKGAYHGFDNPGFANGMRLLGMWLAYDRSVARQSKLDLREFLAARLAR